MLLLLFVPVNVSAAGPQLAPLPTDFDTFLGYLKEAGELFKSMIVVALIIQAIVGFLKYRGSIKEDKAVLAIVIGNSLFIFFMAVVKIFNPNFDLMVFEEYASLIMDSSGAFTPIALILITQFSKYFYDKVLRGVPVVGYSHTLENYKAYKTPIEYHTEVDEPLK